MTVQKVFTALRKIRLVITDTLDSVNTEFDLNDESRKILLLKNSNRLPAELPNEIQADGNTEKESKIEYIED